MSVLVRAGVNALIFCRGPYRSMASWDEADIEADGTRRRTQFCLVSGIALVLA
jgi:hypothetical protein